MIMYALVPMYLFGAASLTPYHIMAQLSKEGLYEIFLSQIPGTMSY